MELKWSVKHFSELSAKELFDIYKLRVEIFVVEQNCPYQEVDNKDLPAFHLSGYHENELVAYCRILPKNISYPETSIGRVVVKASFRKYKLGTLLMEKAMQEIKTRFPKEGIRISAQSHLENFYASLGFVSTGKRYLEDDIPHVEMLFST